MVRKCTKCGRHICRKAAEKYKPPMSNLCKQHRKEYAEAMGKILKEDCC